MPCCAVPNQAYEELTKKLRELDALNGISGLLGWDELVSHPKAHTLLTYTLSKRAAGTPALAVTAFLLQPQPHLPPVVSTHSHTGHDA